MDPVNVPVKRFYIAYNKGGLWLTIPIAILLVITLGGGVFITNLYRDTTNLVVQAIGQDVITPLIATPTLVISVLLTKRGWQQAYLIWLGILVYIVYTYVGYAFSARFNSLFLIYVALLGCTTHALIGGLATMDSATLKAYFTEQTPTKTVAVYLALIATLFYLL